jgi:uncharacterized protein YjhX (UPF0386 family)
MTIPDWVSAIVGLCSAAVAAGKTLAKVRASQLGPRERELLGCVAEDGMFLIVHSPGHGLYLETKQKSFANDDPAITAHYLDAFLRLCDAGLVIHQNGSAFRLTGQGFDLARKLRDNRPLDL